MDYLDRRDTTNAHLQGILIQNLAWVVAAGQGSKDPSVVSFVNPYGQILQQQQAKEIINPRIAKTFLALSTEGKVPTWVVGYVDVALIRNAAK